MPKPPAFDEKTALRVEAVYTSPDEVRQRAFVMGALDPRSGESVMDIGSGPGFCAAEIAGTVGPSGRVLGVDSSPPMIELAKKRCAGLSQASFREGEATSLPAGEGEFDAALSTQVYEYVSDMPKALAELYRILRPGGRAVILDTDWSSVVWSAKDEGRAARIIEAWDRHLVDPHLPRTLSGLLRTAGFEIMGREVHVIFNPDFDPDCYSRRMLDIIVPFVIRHGGIDKEEAKAWSAELDAIGEAGEYFFSLNRYLFVARRPG